MKLAEQVLKNSNESLGRAKNFVIEDFEIAWEYMELDLIETWDQSYEDEEVRITEKALSAAKEAALKEFKKNLK